jgi:hypothetical protein
MRASSFAAAFVALALIQAPSILAQSSQGGKEDPDQPVQGGGNLPEGWSARPDGTADVKSVSFVEMEPGYHLTLGPATILYRQRDMAKGGFHTLARFHQMKKPKHPEGYGLFMGGQGLASQNQQYTYFLVRGDGTYLIKRRDGDKTTEITKGWTAHPAIKKADAEGKATNLLEIDAKKDAGRIDFKANGQTVHSAGASEIGTKGIVGIRANHNLDLHIEEFDLHQ